MTMYDCVWLYMTIYNYVWLCMTMHSWDQDAHELTSTCGEDSDWWWSLWYQADKDQGKAEQ